MAGAAREGRVLSRRGDAGLGLAGRATARSGPLAFAARQLPPLDAPARAAAAAAPAVVPCPPRLRSAPAAAPGRGLWRVRRRLEDHGAVRVLLGQAAWEMIVVLAPTRLLRLCLLGGAARRLEKASALDVTCVELNQAQYHDFSLLGQPSVARVDVPAVEYLSRSVFWSAIVISVSGPPSALIGVFASVGRQVCGLPRTWACSGVQYKLAPGASRLPAPDRLLFVAVSWLQQGAVILGAHRSCRRPGESLTAFREIVAPVRQGLGLKDVIVDLVMYHLRHCGTNANCLAGPRSTAEIQHRGRWASGSSVRRYQRNGRVNGFQSRCSAPMTRSAAKCLETVLRILQSVLAPLPAPVGLRGRWSSLSFWKSSQGRLACPRRWRDLVFWR